VGALERGNYLLVVKVKAAPGVGLLLGTLYDGRRFDDATIARMLERLQTLLHSVAANPNARLGELKDLLIEAERRERIMEKRQRQEINLTNFMQVSPKAVSLSTRELIKTDYLQPGATFPLVVQPSVDDVDLTDWAQGNLRFIEDELSKHGSILFRGFGVDSVVAFENFARAIRPELYGEYGDLPREGVSGKVYQSTPYPADKTILFHNESSHMHRWPMKQWFYCVKAAQEGGETPIVDCRKVCARLDPKIVESFRQKKLMYVRNFVEGLDVSWQAFFHTTDKSVIEEACRNAAIKYEWTANNGLRTYQICPGVAKHPRTGDMVFFNQVQLHHVSFLDPEVRESMLSLFKREDLPRNVCYGDGSPIEDSVMQEISKVYWETAVSFPWQEGDILMLDNMLTAHARNPFKGERKIVVALAELVAATDVSD
jgi:alpha-ketoglutarate-dependent taurine dioxygenase